ncbi:uncharacterized protein LOC132152282 [Carassius carassius]|uniref:uncharacterized protein LOC132152282 n=1 Tax=Carassius carassius TaxID=217509 RepID=UPI0028693500|nr:uncharacterized protein LOC132152282 [Carassius carassius]
MAHVMEDEGIWSDRDLTEALFGDTDRPGLDEHTSKTNVEDCEASGGLYCTIEGLTKALGSVASLQLWNLMGFSLPVPSLFTWESSSLKSSDMHCEESEVKREDAMEVSSPQETYVAQFESEYINHCKFTDESYQTRSLYIRSSMKNDLHRVQHTGLSEFVSSICISVLKTPPASSPSSVLSPPGLQAKSYPLWQELPQVKRHLNSLSVHKIQLQEAMFELIVSEASYQKSLIVALNVFQCSAELKGILPRVQHHVLFSNLKDVCRVSERWLTEKEMSFSVQSRDESGCPLQIVGKSAPAEFPPTSEQQISQSPAENEEAIMTTAQRLVEGTKDNLKKYVRDFEGVKVAAAKFVSWANDKLEEMDNYELLVQTALPEKRVRRKKRMPGELLDDEPVASSDSAFEVNVHNVILDTVAALQEISKCLLRFDDRATVSTLQTELSSLAYQWDRRKQSSLEGYTVRTCSEVTQEV